MSDIKLSLSSRANLLSLQNTSNFLNRTSSRLSTGLKVANPLDDAPAYFAAQSLTYRATDFKGAQSGIDQAISAVTAAIDGLKAIEKYVQTAQGTLTSLLNASSMTASEGLRATYNTLLTQIDNLANATTYQGKNLINSSTESLGINFDEDTATNELTIVARRSNSVGLGLTTVAQNAFFTNSVAITSRPSMASLASVPSIASVASRESVAYQRSLGSVPSMASVASTPTQPSMPSSVVTFAPGSTALVVSQASIASVASVASRASIEARSVVETAPSVSSIASVASVPAMAAAGSIPSSALGGTVAGVNTTLISATQNSIQDALTALRTSQSALGTNVAVLQIRLDFTKNYVNTLTTGSDKMTLADMNEEGANLTSLQTRQQLGITSLSISTRSEESILKLF